MQNSILSESIYIIVFIIREWINELMYFDKLTIYYQLMDHHFIHRALLFI